MTRSKFKLWFENFKKNHPWLYYFLIVLLVLILSGIFIFLLPSKEKVNGLWLPSISIFGTLGTLFGFLLTLEQLNKLRSEEELVQETTKKVQLEYAISKYKLKIKEAQDKINEILVRISNLAKIDKQFLDECSSYLISIHQGIYTVSSEKRNFEELPFNCDDCLTIIENLKEEILKDIDSLRDEDLPSRAEYSKKFNDIWKKITDLYNSIK